MMRKQNRGSRRNGSSNPLAAAALREAARLGSIAGSLDPANTAEMRDALSTLLAAEETVHDLARRFMQARAS